jgi:hypothetical protein
VAGAIAGVGWHFSTVLLRPDRTVYYPERLVRFDAGPSGAESGPVRAWFVRTRFTEQPGRWAVRWVGGKALLGPPTVAGDLVARDWTGPRPEVPPGGLAVGVDCVLNDLDPGSLGLDFAEVAVPGPLGDYTAWFVPATPAEDTWVIAVHGRGMDRRECLRVLPTLHRAGLPVLAVGYRNDPGAPPSPDGWYHLGDTEWADVEAAVRYALDAGAKRIVLYGWSMGAAISGAFLSRSELAGAVVGVVWDCPVVDWWATLRRQAAARRLPPVLIRVVGAITRARAGIDLNRFALHRRPPAHRPPTLAFHGALDTATPAAATRALAAAAPALDWSMRYVEVPGAEHTATWNADPERYEAIVTEFLAGLNTVPTRAVARWST